MAVAAHRFLVAQGLRECLAERDAHVLDGVMRVDMQIAVRVHLQIEHAVPRHLIEHVVEERHACRETRASRAVEVQFDRDLGLEGVASDVSLAQGHAGCGYR